MMRARRGGSARPQLVPDAGAEVLTIKDLRVEFGSAPARTTALRGVDLALHAGRVLGVAGESGSGKTTAALAAMGLLSHAADVQGSIRYRDTELLTLSERELRGYRGSHLAMIFQETSAALNPVIRVGDQLMMAAIHQGLDARFFRWPYQATVMKTLDRVSRPTVCRATGNCMAVRSDLLNGLSGNAGHEGVRRTVSGNLDERIDLQQWNQHEGALRHARMRHFKRAGCNLLLTVQ